MAKLSREQYAELHCVAKSVRIAYPRIFEAEEDMNGKVVYSCQLRFMDDNPEHMAQVEKLKELRRKAAEWYWGKDAPRILERLENNENHKWLRHSPEGYWFVKLKRSEDRGAPRVVGRGKETLSQADGKIYSGCFVNAVFDLWCYGGAATKGTYGFGATLLGIQFVKDGDPFGGASQAKDEDFEDLSGDDKEDDFDII